MQKQINVFNNYVDTFDLTQAPIIRKKVHSARVMEISGEIARKLGLDAENIWLAKIIGLLHDIGRFEQWTRYKTFADMKSTDHGQLGIDVLFGDNLIEKFEIDPKHYPVIKAAVFNHNKFEVKNPSIQDQIIRDADKIDIMDINLKSAGKIPLMANEKVGISPAVLQTINDKKMIRHEICKTIADSVLGYLCFAYDLYTDPAKKIFKKRKYPLRVFKSYKHMLAPEDSKIVRDVAKRIMGGL